MVYQYLPESRIHEIYDYFINKHNRSDEFISHISNFIDILTDHRTYDSTLQKAWICFTQCEKDVAYLNNRQDPNQHFWKRWLKKMDYIFNNIIWMF